MSLKLKSFYKLNIPFCYFDKNLLFVNDSVKNSTIMSSYFKSVQSKFETEYKQIEKPKEIQRNILAEKILEEKAIDDKNAFTEGVGLWVEYLTGLENDAYEQ